MPIAGKSVRVFQLSRYSALPMKLIRRGSTASRKAESRNDRWLAATMTGPVAGTLARPRISAGQSKRLVGRSIARARG